MQKYKYIICFLSFLTLLSLIEINKYTSLKAFDDNFILATDVENTIPIEKEEEQEEYQEEITDLQTKYQNTDVVGTLEILNTDYKVPLVQGKDNNYYLRRLPNKEYNIMGSIFLDYRVNIDTSKKLLIYGHNDRNIEMPFDILENYYDENYLNSHKNVLIKTKNKVREYELFSIFIETSDFSYMKVDYENSSYLEHLYDLKEKSMIKLDVSLEESDNILILQTCSTHKDYLKYAKKYLLLVFKEINI